MNRFSRYVLPAALAAVHCGLFASNATRSSHAQQQLLTWEGDSGTGVAAFAEANWTGPDGTPGDGGTPVSNGTMDPGAEIMFNLLVETGFDSGVYEAEPAVIGPVNGDFFVSGGFTLTIAQDAEWRMNIDPAGAGGGFIFTGTSAQNRATISIEDNAFVRTEAFRFMEVNLSGAANVEIDSPSGFFNQSLLALDPGWTGAIDFVNQTPEAVSAATFVTASTTVGGQDAVLGENIQIVSNGASGALLTVIGQDSTPGDYNGDGVVNAADYTVWRDNLGLTFDLPNKDPLATTPDVVDAEDYLFWRSQFGEGEALTALNASVTPEPASLAMIAAVASVSLVRARRRVTRDR
ncbi:MAG: hypothetical protein AAGB00_01265 [Planctomycetota bacterium]